MMIKLHKIAFCVIALIYGMPAFSNVKVSLEDGANGIAVNTDIENNAARLLSEFNNAFRENRALRLSGIVMPDAEQSLEMLWENVHFELEDNNISEKLLMSSDGYQIRNIPLKLQAQDDTEMDSPYKEGVINFNRQGKITSFYFSIDNNTYKKIMEKGIELDDLAKRMEILDYVERFRTSYNQKDMKFLNQVFSEDALIITGKVVMSKPGADGMSIVPSIKYSKQSKQQYLRNLGNVFRKVKYINVTFDEVKVKRHGNNPNIYGVTVKQGWNTNTYSDVGYVFMMWDFSDENCPQIHVRTWQPYYMDKAKTEVIPEDEIFDLTSFDGI